MSKIFNRALLYVFLFAFIINLFVVDRTYATNSNHINLSREITTKNDKDEILNNGNNNVIFIGRNATISLMENLVGMDDHPIFRISYNNVIDNSDRNSECFFMGHNSRIVFGDNGLEETRIILRNNIATNHSSNNTVVFRYSPVVIELGINVIETSKINIISSKVTLTVSINDERSVIGGLVGIRDNCNPYLNPIFYITCNSTLNIAIDENSAHNMVRGRAYRVIYGFNNMVGRERIVLSPDSSRFGIRGRFRGNDYFISIDNDYVPVVLNNNANVISILQNNNLLNNIGTNSISGL